MLALRSPWRRPSLCALAWPTSRASKTTDRAVAACAFGARISPSCRLRSGEGEHKYTGTTESMCGTPSGYGKGVGSLTGHLGIDDVCDRANFGCMERKDSMFAVCNSGA